MSTANPPSYGWQLWLVRVTLFVAGGLLAVGAIHLLPEMRDAVVGAAAQLQFVLAIPTLANLVESYPSLIVFLAGGLTLGTIIIGLIARPLTTRFLGRFNSNILHPLTQNLPSTISEGSAQFVRLAWILGESGPRADAWKALHHWAQDQGGRPFSVAILVGRSGSGKSRMANEFGRSLARRDVLGGNASGASLGWKVGAYWRRTVGFPKPRIDDPWDSGVLLEAADEGKEAYLARLAKWRPRTRTLLILDDPGKGEAKRVIEKLSQSDFGRHSVRLLIVNQAVPADSPFEFLPEEKAWTFDDEPADPPPIALPRNSWLSDKECRVAIFESGALEGRSTELKTLVRENIFKITHGNPLLVELAVEYFLDGGEPEQITAEILSEARAKRILKALDAAGVSGTDLSPLVVSALVGGFSNSTVVTELDKVMPGHTALLDPQTLSHAFPSNFTKNGDENFLPAIKPDLIADQFIEIALHRIGVAMAPRIVEAAFACSTPDMLIQLARTRSKRSLLGTLFDDLDIHSFPGVNRLDLAKAMFDRSAILSVSAAEVDVHDLRQSHVDALVTIEALQSTPEKSEHREFIEYVLSTVRMLKHEFGEQLVVDASAFVQLASAANGCADDWAMPISMWREFIELFADLNDIDDFGQFELSGLAVSAKKGLHDDKECLRLLYACSVIAAKWRPVMLDALDCFTESQFEGVRELYSLLNDGMQSDAQSRPQRLAEWAEKSRNQTDQPSNFDWIKGNLAGVSSANRDGLPLLALELAELVVEKYPPEEAHDEEIYRAIMAILREAGHGELPRESEAIVNRLRALADYAERVAENLGGDQGIASAVHIRGREAYFWNQFPAGKFADRSLASAKQALNFGQNHLDSLRVVSDIVTALRYAAFAYKMVPGGRGAAQIEALADEARSLCDPYMPHAGLVLIELLQFEEYFINAYGATGAEISRGAVTAAVERAEIYRASVVGTHRADVELSHCYVSAAHSLTYDYSARVVNLCEGWLTKLGLQTNKWPDNEVFVRARASILIALSSMLVAASDKALIDKGVKAAEEAKDIAGTQPRTDENMDMYLQTLPVLASSIVVQGTQDFDTFVGPLLNECLERSERRGSSATVLTRFAANCRFMAHVMFNRSSPANADHITTLRQCIFDADRLLSDHSRIGLAGVRLAALEAQYSHNVTDADELGIRSAAWKSARYYVHKFHKEPEIAYQTVICGTLLAETLKNTNVESGTQLEEIAQFLAIAADINSSDLDMQDIAAQGLGIIVTHLASQSGHNLQQHLDAMGKLVARVPENSDLQNRYADARQTVDPLGDNDPEPGA